MNEQENSMLEARTLGQLLLMQSVIPNLPDQALIFDFVCKGLLDIPGVEEVNYFDSPEESLDPSIARFPLLVSGSWYGELLLQVSDPLAFAPYEDYLRNFSFMVAVILEERSQCRLNELYQSELERRVEERTRQLREEITERQHTENALRESEELFSTIFHSSPALMAIARVDDNQIIKVNQKFLDTLGLSQDEVIGKTSLELGLLVDPQERADAFEKIKTTGSLSGFEMKLRKKDGSQISVVASAEIIHIGKEQCLLTGAIDNTERKQTEEALEENREKYRGLSEASFEAIFISEKGVCLEQNQTAERMFGYSDSEALGRVGTEWIALEDRDTVMNNMLSGYEKPYEVTALRKDGSTFPALIRGKTMHYKGRTVRVTSLQDITERKQAEAQKEAALEALRASEARLHVFFEHANDAIHIDNDNDEILDVNRRMCELMGYSRAELLKMRIADLQAPEYKMSGNVIQNEMEKYGNTPFEKLNIHRDGRRIPVEVSISRIEDPQGDLYISILRDITERKQAEEGLQRNEEKFRNLFNNTEIAMFRSRLDGTETLDINQRFLDLIGKTREETIGKPSQILWADPKEREEMVQRLLADGRVSEFEFKFLSAQKGVRNCVTSLRLYREQGILEGSIADITERKQAEEGLQRSEEKYRLLVENMNAGVFQTSLEGAFIQMNSTMAEMAGYENVDELMSKPALSLYANPADREHLKETLALHGEVSNMEVRTVKKDGTQHWISLNAVLQKDKDGKPEKILGIASDITERKHVEEALRQSEERNRALLKALPDLIFVFNRQGVFVDHSSMNEGMLLIPPSVFIGKNVSEVLPPEIADLTQRCIKQVFETGQIQVYQYSLLMGDETRFYESRLVLKSSDEALSIVRDITEGKRAEEALRESTAKFETMIHVSPLAIILVDINGNVQLWNSSAERIFGWSAQEVVGYPNPSVPADKQDEYAIWSSQIAQGKTLHDQETVRQRKDGTLVDVSISSSPIYDGAGNVMGRMAILADISERKRTESQREAALEDLRKSEEKYRLLVENMNAGVFQTTLTGEFLQMNSSVVQIAGYEDIDELMSQPASCLYADIADRERLKEALMRQGEVRNMELRSVKKDGTQYWISMNAVLQKDGDGKPEKILGIVNDITERKQAEEALREREARLKTITENTPDSILQVDRHGLIHFVNQLVPGLTIEEVIGSSIYKWVPEEQYPILKRAFEAAFSAGECGEYESMGPGPNGEKRVYSVRVMPVIIDGKTDSAIYTATDVTERKRVEEALRESNTKLEAMIQVSPLAILLIDLNGNIQLWNSSAERIFGWSAQEVIGRPNPIVPANKQDEYDAWGAQIMRGKAINDQEAVRQRKDGALIDVSVSSSPIHDSAGNVVGRMAIIADITARKQAESQREAALEALRQSEEKFRDLFENMNDGFALHKIVLDENGKPVDYEFLDANPIFIKRAGMKPEDLINHRALELFPNTEQSWIDMFGKVAITGEPEQIVNYSAELDKYFETRIYCPQPGLFAALFSDVTERKKAEDEAFRRNKELAALNKVAKEIVTNVSLDECIKAVIDQVAASLTADLVLFFTNENDALQLHSFGPLDSPYLHTRTLTHRIGECLCGLAADHRKPTYSINILNDFRCTWKECKEAGLHSFASLPLLSGGELVGVLGIGSVSERDFQQQSTFLETIAEQAAIAIRNAQLYSQVQRHAAELEQHVRERTLQLETANKEMESFSYSVSHDLRAPLRGIDGWSQALLEDYYDKLDEQGRQYIDRVRSETQRMGHLIDDMLELSRLTRAEMHKEQVELSALARAIADRLQKAEPLRKVDFNIEPGLTAEGDPYLLEAALANLLGNAFKFTAKRADARIEFGQTEAQGQRAFFVRDNGAGFDMTYAKKLFGAFQRMHKAAEFPGTGIGLATVQRVIHRHGGRVWAEAEVDRGATFYFTFE